ncbi:hypothetical protein HPB51_026625 [Rhipicephalus microplus]|uniref:Uncharacterized protein n=1 Tax=Rhipicephalus microplus TaxID=6941 RepID=A0A9J6D2J8_RHIMP|nr:hypothetical protein HPB51_026625 [Rhipicephalus microplus]
MTTLWCLKLTQHSWRRPFLNVSFHLRRSLKRHRYAITVPLVAVTLVMFSAFWMPPVSDRRLTLAALNILILALMLERTTARLGLSVATLNITRTRTGCLQNLLHLHAVLFLGIATVVQVVVATGNVLALNLLSSRVGVKVPDALHRALSGKAADILCLCDQEPETSARPEDAQQPPAFDEFHDRRRRWIRAAQALDRLFFIVLGFAAIGLLA